MNINKETVRRIATDVKYILKNPLDNENIFYKHDMENLLKGYALIIGNKNTPYSHGYYFFQFDFPYNYPYLPPKVTFLTNDGHMRFNPNLYTNGKVCLSVLNTWKGEGWTSCQTINSILLILGTVLNDKPLLNEPGINNNNPNIENYNLVISYKNIEFSIIKQIDYMNLFNDNSPYQTNNKYFNIIHDFKDIIKSTFINNKELIKENIIDLEKKLALYNSNNSIYVSTYNLNCLFNIDKLKIDINNIKII